jgi:hypothetical protein
MKNWWCYKRYAISVIHVNGCEVIALSETEKITSKIKVTRPMSTAATQMLRLTKQLLRLTKQISTLTTPLLRDTKQIFALTRPLLTNTK